MEDGTVVGTYAWIDDDGYLRQRDYIADNGGYRILKNKNVYVGRNTPISQAIKSAKKAPANAGVLVKNNDIVKVTPKPVESVTPFVEILHNSIPSSTPSQYLSSPELHSISTTPVPPNLYLPASTGGLHH